MNPTSKSSSSAAIRNPQSPILFPNFEFRISNFPLTPRRRLAAFTLVELLVVISIIGLLAGLAVPAIGGAMKSAKKAEVAAVAQSIRTAVLAWNSEYGTWPISNSFAAGTYWETKKDFLDMITYNTNNPAASAANPRGIIFLEVPAKFTNSDGLVTPNGYLKGSNALFSFVVDTNSSGQVTARNGTTQTNLRTAVAVWAPDSADPTKKSVGTWK